MTWYYVPCTSAPGTEDSGPSLKQSVLGRPGGTIMTDGDSGSPQADLNPRFVEALMGLPPNWLSPCISVETDSFRRWLRTHSLLSPTVPASTSDGAE